MSRHKKRIHKKIVGKFQDRRNGRKARIPQGSRYHQNAKSAQKARRRRQTFLIGGYKY